MELYILSVLLCNRNAAIFMGILKKCAEDERQEMQDAFFLFMFSPY